MCIFELQFPLGYMPRSGIAGPYGRALNLGLPSGACLPWVLRHTQLRLLPRTPFWKSHTSPLATLPQMSREECARYPVLHPCQSPGPFPAPSQSPVVPPCSLKNILSLLSFWTPSIILLMDLKFCEKQEKFLVFVLSTLQRFLGWTYSRSK